MAKAIIKQLAHVCIFAHDLEATRAFYQDVLGMPIAFNFERNGKWYGFYLTCGGRTNIEVFAKAEARFADTDAIGHMCLETNGLDEAIAQIRAAGFTVTDKKQGVDESWQAWTTDPNGVKIELFEYTDRSAQFVGGDRIANW